MQLFKALACQIAGLVIVFMFARMVPLQIQEFWIILLLQGVTAASMSWILRQPIWWLPIHLFFVPSAIVLSTMNLPAWLYLLVFTILILIFWGTIKGDVPLFLSSAAVAEAIVTLVKRENISRFAEFGAGIGTVVMPLAISLPELKIDAVEKAPLPLLVMKLRCRLLPNVSVQNKNLWDCELAKYDLVFAFLSPLYMEQLGEKVRNEMRSGSLFVSSSFSVPDWKPELVIKLQDRRKTELYCYRV